MESVKISPKFQIVIPKRVREGLGLRPGQVCQIIEYEGRIEVIPVRPIESLRGSLRGIDTEIIRDEDRA